MIVMLTRLLLDQGLVPPFIVNMNPHSQHGYL